MIHLMSIVFVLASFLPIQAFCVGEKTVLLSILARNKEHVLPRYLKCIDALDYDKKLITVYINTNNNEDNTEKMLQRWAQKRKDLYYDIVFESHEVEDLPSARPHEWNSTRFKVLGAIRNTSLQKAKEYNCDYYFVVDCDNFIAPSTLNVLVSKNKPIIAPLLRAIPEKGDPYSNYFYDISQDGYYKDHPDYWKILNRQNIGVFMVPVVHCTYLVKSKYIDQLSYIDETDDYEFIIFSRIARRNNVQQYICNEEEFGVLAHFHTDVSIAEENRRLQEYFRGVNTNGGR